MKGHGGNKRQPHAWRCEVCGFFNDDTRHDCMMCTVPRGVSLTRNDRNRLDTGTPIGVIMATHPQKHLVVS